MEARQLLKTARLPLFAIGAIALLTRISMMPASTPRVDTPATLGLDTTTTDVSGLLAYLSALEVDAPSDNRLLVAFVVDDATCTPCVNEVHGFSRLILTEANDYADLKLVVVSADPASAARFVRATRLSIVYEWLSLDEAKSIDLPILTRPDTTQSMIQKTMLVVDYRTGKSLYQVPLRSVNTPIGYKRRVVRFILDHANKGEIR